MKKILRWAVAAMTLLVFGSESYAGKDIGKLQPVQVVCMSRSGSEVLLWTDTGQRGSGFTPEEALCDIKSTAPGEIFLDTADYLILTADCVDLLDEMSAIVRPSCSLCLMEGEPDLERVGQFLSVHVPQVTLVKYRAGRMQLQTLKTADGRMSLVS